MSDLQIATIKLIIAAMFAGSIALFMWGGKGVRDEIPDDDRRFKDPLPPLLKIIWPIVKFFSFYLGRFVSVERLEKMSVTLKRAGVDYVMSPEQLFGLQCTGAFLLFSLVGYSLYLIDSFDWLVMVIVLVVGYFLPGITIREKRKGREKDIVKMLPTYLDFFTMTVQAGMNLSGAMAQAIEKGPGGVLNHEFQRVMRDVKAGMSRMDALRAMAERLDIRELNTFVSAVAQSEKTGSSIGETLKIQADQRRIERFQRAEKLAMEAPVKLIFPLVAFIFPMTFLMLGFPIAMKFIYET